MVELTKDYFRIALKIVIINNDIGLIFFVT